MNMGLRAYIQKYDIRGYISNKFGPTQAYLVGKGFAEIVKARGRSGHTVVVGCDIRPSSPEMLTYLIEGLADSGINVKSITICTTPMLRFAATFYKTSGAIMVTASHNPLDENGFKFFLNGHCFFDQGLQELCEIVEKQKFTHGIGGCTEESLEDLYLENLCKDIQITGNLTVNWISNSEYMRVLLSNLLNKLPGKHIISNCIQNSGADLTFDFDTDADRMIMYDSNLRQWHGDEIIAFYALHIKQQYPDLKVIFDLKCSRVLLAWLQDQGISCDMSRVGSCFIEDKLRKTKSHLGGELSGHFMFRDYNDFSDDGIHSALRVLHYLSKGSHRIESFLEIFPKIHVTKTIKVPCVGSKFEIIEQIRSQLVAENINMHDNEEDAILVHQSEGWFIIRISQTENLISVRCEGFREDLLDALLLKVEYLFSEVGLSLW